MSRTTGWNADLVRFHRATSAGNHFIDSASRSHAISEFRRLAPPIGSTILEVGCAPGVILRTLMDSFPGRSYIGSEFNDEALADVRNIAPGADLKSFDLATCPLPDASIDVVIALNVLEHIEDDASAMGHIARILKPGGSAIIEVPASPSLFDVYDEALMHYRRYRMADLRRLITSSGLLIDRSSHLGFLIFPAFYAIKRINQFRSSDAQNAENAAASLYKMSNKTSPIMSTVMKFEAMARRVFYLPFGIRCLVTCQKPDAQA